MQYGILDDENVVVRWLWTKPPYPHIERKVKRSKKPKIDLATFKEALF